MTLDSSAQKLLKAIIAQSSAAPRMLAMDVYQLSDLVLGRQPREPGDPYLEAALRLYQQAVRLESLDWTRTAMTLVVTYEKVLSVARLVFAWRAMNRPQEEQSRELMSLVTRHCSERRPHHLRAFWPQLEEGTCSESFRVHLLVKGSNGPREGGPYLEEVFPFHVFRPETLLNKPYRPPVPEPDLAPELQELLATLSCR
jgi:hypothetical protein